MQERDPVDSLTIAILGERQRDAAIRAKRHPYPHGDAGDAPRDHDRLIAEGDLPPLVIGACVGSCERGLAILQRHEGPSVCGLYLPRNYPPSAAANA